MVERNWKVLYQNAFANKRPLCAGLDPSRRELTERDYIKTGEDPIPTVRDFCRNYIDAVSPVVGFLKLNWIFFLEYGPTGLALLQDMICYSKKNFPEVAIIVDCKVGDVPNTSQSYADTLFGVLKADAVTINGSLGREAYLPFLERKDKGVFVLCHTSNKGSEEIQEVLDEEGVPQYCRIARTVHHHWNQNDNCGLVVGATYPDVFSKVREFAPTLPLLVPGAGEQGGDWKTAVTSGRLLAGAGVIVSASRSIMFAEDQRQAATNLTDEIINAKR